MNYGHAAGFLAGVADGLIVPVNILRLEISDVALRTAEQPAQFVKGATLWIFFASDDEQMFREGDGAFGFEPDFRPKAFGNQRPRQPVHADAKIMKLSQVNIRADRSRLEAGEQMFCFGLKNHALANEV